MRRPFLSVFLTIVIAVAAYASLPLTAASWVNVTGNLANMPSECGNLTTLSAVPGSDAILAGVALKGLWSNSAGTTWVHLGSGAGSDVITNRPSSIVYDPLDSRIFWESGIYNGGGIYKTMDGGNTFRRLGMVTHNDYVSVDFADPNRQILLAGGHEQTRIVYKSTDGGQTWTNIGATLPADSKFPSNPIFANSQTYVVNSQGWGSGTNAIYRTTNNGASWQQVSLQGPGMPPLVTSTGTIIWANNGGLLKSSDAGATWTQIGSGLQNVRPIELPDRKLASVGANTLVVSNDGGSTWSPIGPNLPYRPWGLIYSANRQAFFIWTWDCGGVVLPNAIMQLDFPVLVGQAPSPPTNVRIVAAD
jgi:photosystem II stability/assembly factor-like uncharacterized protein